MLPFFRANPVVCVWISVHSSRKSAISFLAESSRISLGCTAHGAITLLLLITLLQCRVSNGLWTQQDLSQIKGTIVWVSIDCNSPSNLRCINLKIKLHFPFNKQTQRALSGDVPWWVNNLQRARSAVLVHLRCTQVQNLTAVHWTNASTWGCTQTPAFFWM